MARISPFQDDGTRSESRTALDEILAAHGRVTNMKRTLARSPVALHALMTWYDLRDEVVPFLGERLTTLFAHAISAGTDCLVCSTFFRRLLIDSGEDPGRLAARRLGADRRRLRPATGRRPARRLRRAFRPPAARLEPEQIVALTAFGGLMVATNLFNNALQVDLDDYLQPYRKESAVMSADAAQQSKRRPTWPVRSP